MSTEVGASASTIDQLTQLHRQGQYLQAYELAKQNGPFKEWKTPAEQIIGGRLAHNLGSERLGRLMHRAAFESAPHDPEVIYFYTLSMMQRRGPLASWDLMRPFGDLPDASSEIKADWLALRGTVLAMLRDFEKAETYFEQAIQLHADRPWLYVSKTFLLEQQDRPDEALATAQHAIELSPWYRPAVQNLAHRLVQTNQDEEALNLMREANTRIESGDVRCQLAALLLELQQYEEAREIYEDIDRFYPLMDLDRKRPEWLAARRADAAYYCGDFKAAVEHAKRADAPFYTSLAENLSGENPTGNRVILPVKFVRQNHLTCAPATLSAISNFWDKPAEHLDVVEEICFDGTPAHSERRWANSSGFVTREFRVTMEVAMQLIDRGIPFTLTTVDPGNAHLQAVIGYDSYRQSLIIRDPGERHFNEFQVEEMLKHYVATGPRGMAMVPEEKADLLKDIDFPEAEFYDLFFKVDLALEAHQREQAEEIVNQLRKLDDNHRLTLRARGNLANYDSNVNELLVIAEAMLEKYPDDVNVMMSKLACLNELGRREERISLLEEQIAKPECDPMVWARYASELVDDAREHEKATYYLRRGIRYRPYDTAAYDLLAGVYLDQQKQDEAVELYRFAACINEMNPTQAKSYFCAARVKNQTDSALRFLEDRFERFGSKSSQPTRTLSWALEQVDRTSDAFNVLEKGRELRPDDGDFLLYSADFCGRYGKFNEAAQLLEQAKENSHKTDLLRAHALLGTYSGGREEPLKQWQEIIELEPLNAHAHRCAAELLADTEGPEAAIEHLKAYVDRFPHSYSLRMLLIEWLRSEESDEFRPQLQKFIDLNPNDAWGLRELSFSLLKDRQFEEAEKLINHANDVDPTHPAVNFVRGRVERARGNEPAAKEHFRNSLRLAVDYEFAILGLMECCDTKSEREEELEFVFDELKSQVNFGDGLLSYRECAAQTLEPKILLQRLQEALAARPDLWHAWSSVIRQLSDTQDHEQALVKAKEATERFPLLPRMWMDRALAHAACGDIDGEIEALCKAKEINPAWGEPVRLLSEAYEKKGDLEKAREEIERVIVTEPRDVRNHGFLANLMWEQGQKQEAVDCLTKVVQTQPGYEWAWNALRAWAAELKQDEMVVNITRELTVSRPNDYRSWLLYAESLGEREQIDQAVATLDEAIKLNPTNPEAYNQKAFQLCRAGKFDEAVAATQPAALGGKIPIELKARAAWVEGERGNVDTAVRMMEQVIDQDQDYFWAWHRLAEWYEFLDNTPKYYAAAEQMVRLAPQNPVSWGYMGDAELRKNNRTNAKKNFLQAVQISPAYSFASSRLVDLQLEDKEFDAASETIDLVSPHIPPAWTLSEKVRIESLRGDQDASFAKLNELAVTPAEGSSAIDSAVESLFLAGWGEKVMPIIDQLLNHPDAQPGVAYVYMNLGATLKRWDEMESRLAQIKDRPPIWHEGVKKFLEETATGDEHPRMHKFIAAHGEVLRTDIELWEAVGDAYNSADLFKETLKWMSDWQQREGLTSSMAFTEALAHWHLKQPHESMETIRFALSRLEPDGATGPMLTLAAFYEMAYGSLESCVDAVGMVDPTLLPGIYQLVFQHVVTILENLSTGGSYAELNAQLADLWNSLPPEAQQIPFLSRFHRISNWRAAALHGKKLKAFWLKFKI